MNSMGAGMMRVWAGIAMAVALSVGGGAAWAQQQQKHVHPAFMTNIKSPPLEQVHAMLRQGGYVLFFRHAETDEYPERGPINFSNCATQRNLSPIGREHSRRLGRVIAEAGIPVGGVLASPFCRTMETARLAFGRAAPAEQVRDEDKRAALIATISTPPQPGTNLVVVGHANGNYMFGAEFLREAEAMVIRPQGGGKYELVARIESEQWEKMRPAAR